MRNTIIQRLDIPKSAIINRKIAKRKFFVQGSLTKSEKELFTTEIESIYLLSACNQNTIGVPKFVNDQWHYAEVDWIYVKFKTHNQYKRLVVALHRTLPNPLIIVAEDEQSAISISTSHKRLNQNDSLKVVIEEIEVSPWIDLQEDKPNTQRLLDRMNFNHLSYGDLYWLYNDVHLAICFSLLIDELNCYPKAEANNEDVKRLLNSLRSVKKEISELQQLQKERIDFGGKMELHIKIQQHKKKQNQIHQQLRGMC